MKMCYDCLHLREQLKQVTAQRNKANANNSSSKRSILLGVLLGVMLTNFFMTLVLTGIRLAGYHLVH